MWAAAATWMRFRSGSGWDKDAGGQRQAPPSSSEPRAARHRRAVHSRQRLDRELRVLSALGVRLLDRVRRCEDRRGELRATQTLGEVGEVGARRREYLCHVEAWATFGELCSACPNRAHLIAEGLAELGRHPTQVPLQRAVTLRVGGERRVERSDRADDRLWRFNAISNAEMGRRYFMLHSSLSRGAPAQAPHR